jgi:hypothetical protein
MNTRTDIVNNIIRTHTRISYAELGRRLGVSKKRAYRIALKYGINPRTHARQTLPPETIRRTFELGHRGWSAKEIARNIGHSSQTVLRILASCGRSQWEQRSKSDTTTDPNRS